MKLSLICPTFNGLTLLKKNLPQWIHLLEQENIAFEVIIVDNGSHDGTPAWLKAKPHVVCINLPENRGFAAACNIGFRQARGEYLFFINNDISFMDETPFFNEFISQYESLGNSIFALAPLLIRETDHDTLDDGLRKPEIREGLIDVPLCVDLKTKTLEFGVFFCAAAFLVSKDTFLKLEGFDELYRPFAWEDLDLGMRACKMGLKNACMGQFRLLHQRETTSRKIFTESQFKRLVWRNKFIFMWRHFDKQYLWQHLYWLPVKLIKFSINGRLSYVLGFFMALIRIPQIVKRRFLEKGYIKKTFTRILEEY